MTLSELTIKASQGREKRGHWEMVKGRLLLSQARGNGAGSLLKLKTFLGILLQPVAITEALSNGVYVNKERLGKRIQSYRQT